MSKRKRPGKGTNGLLNTSYPLMNIISALEVSDDDEDYSPEPDLSQDEEGKRDSISHRTRAHVSLQNVEIEKLADYLQSSPPSSPLHSDFELNYRDEYQSFLSMLSSASELPEDENDLDFILSEEQSNALQGLDSEEYRNDRAVHISREEYEALLRDAGHGSSVPDKEPPKKKSTKRSKKRKKDDSLASSKTEGLQLIRPNNEIIPSPFVFTPEQMNQLQGQISGHFQLLVQTFLLARRVGSRSVQATNWDLLQEFKQEKEAAVLRKMGMGHGDVGEESVLDIPGLALLDHLYDCTVYDVAPSEDTMTSMMNIFKPFFNKDLEYKPTAQTRQRFTPAEDELLAMGLERFGTSAWESIRQHFLPTKSVRQISNRYKNQSSINVPWNSIKTFTSQKVTKRLTPEETNKLFEGVRRFGSNWGKISREVLPRIRPKHLEAIYHTLDDPRKDQLTHIFRKPTNNVSEPQLSEINSNFLRSPPPSTYLDLSLEEPPAEPKDSTEDQTTKSKGPKVKVEEEQAHPPTARHFEHIDLDMSDESLSEEESGSSRRLTSVSKMETETMGDNLLFSEGVCIKWNREEDRNILLAAKEKGATTKTWKELAEEGSLSKSPSQIAKRYEQLLELFSQKN